MKKTRRRHDLRTEAAIMGHPKYEVTKGSITLDGKDVLEMEVDERAQAGLFLAMQYQVKSAV